MSQATRHVVVSEKESVVNDLRIGVTERDADRVTTSEINRRLECGEFQLPLLMLECKSANA